MIWSGNKELESWSNYIEYPWEYISTGSTPLETYTRPQYRKPYNFPYVFMQTYPMPNLTYLS